MVKTLGKPRFIILQNNCMFVGVNARRLRTKGLKRERNGGRGKGVEMGETCYLTIRI